MAGFIPQESGLMSVYVGRYFRVKAVDYERPLLAESCWTHILGVGYPQCPHNREEWLLELDFRLNYRWQPNADHVPTTTS